MECFSVLHLTVSILHPEILTVFSIHTGSGSRKKAPVFKQKKTQMWIIS